MTNDIAIQVKNLSKKYILKHPAKNIDGNVTHENWALHDVSFEIKKGEAVGIIGPNGSGKSTLLKILSGVTKPTSGSVEISGRVASILDIGAGFHQELSGRENVFLNGQLLGFSHKEIKEKYYEIVEFSGIGNFIDEPVKNYSNGMYLRLAFSILAHLEFDIYLFDEVMSVGDASFQIKVNQFLNNKMQQATFIFVSHNIAEMQNLLSCFYLLNNGVIKKDESNEIIEDYINDAFEKEDSDLPLNIRSFLNGDIKENDFFELKQVYTNSLEDGVIRESTPIEFFVELLIKKHCRLDLSFGVEGLLGNELFYVTTLLNETSFVDDNLPSNKLIFKTKIPAYTLKKGKYILSLTVIANNKTIISRFRTCYFQINSEPRTSNSIIGQRPNVALIFGDWIFKSKTSES
jgi:ABC-type polysaccharide/polyol phosphate transport system ATPase subunit